VVEGALALDGVAGTGAAIRLEFTAPDGAKTGRLLPTGNPIDLLDGLPASLVDAANPCVFFAAADLGLRGDELPAVLERDGALLDRLEALRRLAAVRMGLASDLETAARTASIPKLGLLSAPMPTALLSGRSLPAAAADIVARMISVGQPHRAIPLTGALCLAVACRIPGSIAHRLARPASPITIAHPSGTILVTAEVLPSLAVPHATVFRTARRLFQGEVLWRDPAG
jgi:2-methylaconitate cis-trans-isomerase PrpF